MNKDRSAAQGARRPGRRRDRRRRPARAAAASTAPSAARRAARPGSTRSASPTAAASATAGARRCSARRRPRRVASGEVSASRSSTATRTRPASSTDIRDLIAEGVNAIVVNPNSPDALNPAIAEAIDSGHPGHRDRRIRDRARRLQPVQRPGAVRLPRRQVAVRADGREGRRRLHARHRRPSGRHRPRQGLQEGARRVTRTSRSPRKPSPSWDQATAVEPDQRDHDAAAPSSTASGRPASTTSSSMRSRRPTTRSCRSSARTTPASSSSSSPSPGLKGAAVTNPPAVGGAGVVLGAPAARRQEAASRHVHVTPELWDNTTDAGKAALTAAHEPEPPEDLAPRADDQGLDDLHQGPAHRLQGPGRELILRPSRSRTGMPVPPASPSTSTPSTHEVRATR